MKYIIVIINIFSIKLNKKYIYKTQLNVKIGDCVEVPFGKSNQIKQAYVIGFIEEDHIPNKIEKNSIKEIICIKEKFVSIEAKFIKIALYLSKSLNAPIINCLKTVLPIKRKSVSRNNKKIKLLIDKNKALLLKLNYQKKHQIARLRFIDLLLNNEYILKSDLKKYKLTIQNLNYFLNEKIVEILDNDNFKINNINDIKLDKTKKILINNIQNSIENNILKNYVLHCSSSLDRLLFYIELIKISQKNNKKSIILFPEILLMQQMFNMCKNIFGDKVGILHSQLLDSDKYLLFDNIKKGIVDIVIGTKIALFVPFEKVGLYIIDEFHDKLYKNEQIPIYDTKKVCLYMSKLDNAVTILGSATPSVDYYYYAKNNINNFDLINLNLNIYDKKITVIDMKKELKNGNKSVISNYLNKRINETLKQKKQILVFLNRSGYYKSVVCQNCGKSIKCDICNMPMILVNDNKLKCNCCGHEVFYPVKCKNCNSQYISPFKMGVNRLEKIFNKTYKDINIKKFISDKLNKNEKIIDEFKKQKINILISSKLMINGYNIKNIGLVVSMFPDILLNRSSYDACEDSYDMLLNLYFKINKDIDNGEMIIQTYNSDNYVINSILKKDYTYFYNEEIINRKLLGYKPFSSIMKIIILADNKERLYKICYFLNKQIKEYKKDKDITILGDIKKYYIKRENKYKNIIYCKSKDENILIKLGKYLTKYININSGFKKSYIYFDFC